MHEYLAETFNAGGHLSRELDGYKPRAGQIDYAAAVDNAIRKGRHLMVEGPTGTGKSLAAKIIADIAARERTKQTRKDDSDTRFEERVAEGLSS